MKLYEITSDLLALNTLLESLEDEDGNAREPTEQELETMKEWFVCTESEFNQKVENYCRFIKNLKIEAADIDAERKNYKAELDRLSKRSKASENKAKTIQGLLRWSMERLKMTKFKTALFSGGIQNTQKVITTVSGTDLSALPEKFLKPRELDTVAVKEALTSGELIQKDGPENYSKVFTKDGTLLQGVSCVQGSALVIR